MGFIVVNVVIHIPHDCFRLLTEMTFRYVENRCEEYKWNRAENEVLYEKRIPQNSPKNVYVSLKMLKYAIFHKIDLK